MITARPLPSARQHPSYGECLEVKREYYQNCSVLDCVTQCSQSAAHLYEQFLQVQQIGLSHWDPYTMQRGGCLELNYCNMVDWFWWDSSLISTINWFNRPWNHLQCVEWDVQKPTNQSQLESNGHNFTCVLCSTDTILTHSTTINIQLATELSLKTISMSVFFHFFSLVTSSQDNTIHNGIQKHILTRLRQLPWFLEFDASLNQSIHQYCLSTL